jgi:very-short-patch-repair endonuclease
MLWRNVMGQEEISTSAGQEYICEICKKTFKAITNSHLKHHGITTEEYRKLYPQARFGDFSRFEAWRNSQENRLHLQENTRLVYGNEETLEKKRNARRIACERPEYLKKLSEASKRNSSSENMKKVYSTAKDRISYKMRLSNFERWKLKFGEEEAQIRLQDWSQKNRLPALSKDTSPERAFESFLKVLELKYIKQFRTQGYICDFYLPDYNVVVEIDGDYWHANPKIFSSHDLIGKKKVSAQMIWDHDVKKTKSLIDAEYAVVRYWASELKEMNSQRIFEDIVQASEKLEEAT